MVRVARGGISRLWSFATAERVKCSEKMSRSANLLEHKALAVAQCWTDGAFCCTLKRFQRKSGKRAVATVEAT